MSNGSTVNSNGGIVIAVEELEVRNFPFLNEFSREKSLNCAMSF